MSEQKEKILEVSGLRKKFAGDAGFFSSFGKYVYAVNDVSFALHRNETYGLVGESGCGKTTTARLIVGMYKADDGDVTFFHDGKEEHVFALKGKSLKEFRRKVKYIFQDPARSLNPRMTIFQILTSGYRWSEKWPGKAIAREEAAAILEEVGLSPDDLNRHPGEFSGGQRQRISIARGLLMQPEILLCDEVVSALDVSIQGQILNLLQEIRKKRGLSFLFIAHDLKVACYFCDRIGVMYKGVLMEETTARDLYEKALHPYTQLLFTGMPQYGGEKDAENVFQESEVKRATNEVSGCPFYDRCSHATDKCAMELPPFKPVSGDESHKVRCHFVQAG